MGWLNRPVVQGHHHLAEVVGAGRPEEAQKVEAEHNRSCRHIGLAPGGVPSVVVWQQLALLYIPA